MTTHDRNEERYSAEFHPGHPESFLFINDSAGHRADGTALRTNKQRDDAAMTALAEDYITKRGYVRTGGWRPTRDGQAWTAPTRQVVPAWDDMPDVDKGAALLHVWQVDWEGDEYARAEYPAKYHEHPMLTALSSVQACEHAYEVTGGHEAIFDRLGVAEYERLYDLALKHNADRRKTG